MLWWSVNTSRVSTNQRATTFLAVSVNVAFTSKQNLVIVIIIGYRGDNYEKESHSIIPGKINTKHRKNTDSLKKK